MPDREKLLNDLQELCEYLFHEYKICYKGDEEDTYNRFLAANNALNLLKEQPQWTNVEEAVAPTIREGVEVEKVICCGSCGSALYHLFPWKKISKAREYAQYCRHCGKRVKWDDLQENLELLKEQTEIVRCKDCKHWNKANHDCNIKVGHFTAPPDWFCADGEVNQHE